MRAPWPRLWVLCVLAAALGAPAAGQEPLKGRARRPPAEGNLAARADEIVARYMHEEHVPGLVLAVVRGGKVVVEKGYGVRSPEDPKRPDPNTLFYIGSLSKAITAVGIEVLAEQGKLELDQPIGRQVKGLPRPWRRIPVKLFLAHQSGIPQIETAKQPSFEAMVRTLDDEPMAFRPGTRQEYNNFNFAVAGQLIERASGKPYLKFMREEVFLPLGMTRTGYGQEGANASPGHYRRPSGRLVVVEEAVPKGGEYAIPSGFLQTTLADLLKLYRGIQHHTLLPVERTREMITPIARGMTGTPGWFARKAGGVTIVAKNGAASGYSSQFQFVPGRGDAVIFIMNLQGKALRTHSLAAELLREVCGLPLPEPKAEQLEDN